MAQEALNSSAPSHLERTELTKLFQQAEAGAEAAKGETSAGSSKAACCVANEKRGCKGGVVVQHSSSEGRRLVADRPAALGSLLLHEEPFAAVVSKTRRKSVSKTAPKNCLCTCTTPIACICFRPDLCDGQPGSLDFKQSVELDLDAALQHCWACFCAVEKVASTWCPKCTIAVYCSPECRRADKVHALGALCGVAWPVLLPENGVLAAVVAAKSQVSRMPAWLLPTRALTLCPHL